MENPQSHDDNLEAKISAYMDKNGVSRYDAEQHFDLRPTFGHTPTPAIGPGDLLAPTGKAEVSGREMARRHANNALDNENVEPAEQLVIPGINKAIAQAAIKKLQG